MQRLIKYIFLILTIMVNSDLYSQNAKPISIPVYVFQLQKDGSFVQSNQGITILVKPIVGKWENAVKLTQNDSVFIYTGYTREWLEFKITDSLGNNHYRKVYPYYHHRKIAIGLYIGTSEFHSYFQGVKKPYLPMKDTFDIVGGINLLPIEVQQKLGEIGLRSINITLSGNETLNSPVYTFIENKKYSRKQQYKELLSIQGIGKILPVIKLNYENNDCFYSRAAVLFTPTVSPNKIESILKKLNVKSFTQMTSLKQAAFEKYGTGQAVFIQFTSEQMINYEFLKILDHLYLQPDVLLINTYSLPTISRVD